MSKDDRITIRGVNKDLLEYVALKSRKKTDKLRIGSRRHGDVINQALGILLLLIYDQQRFDPNLKEHAPTRVFAASLARYGLNEVERPWAALLALKRNLGGNDE